MALLPVLLATAAVSAPSAAPSQAPPAWAGADFGGGSVGAVYRPEEADGPTREVSARFSDDGRMVDLYAGAFARCSDPEEEPFVPVTASGAVAADGSFTATGDEFDEDQVAEAKLSAKVTMSGTTGAAGVRGTLKIDAVLRRGTRRITCNTVVRPFELRRVPGELGATAPARPGTTYFGTSRQVGGSWPFPFGLRVAAGGRRVINGFYRVAMRCTDGVWFTTSGVLPQLPVGADGRFRHTNRYTVRFPDWIDRYAEVWRGGFRDGGVSGTLELSVTGRSRKGKPQTSKCSRRVAWNAVPPVSTGSDP